MLYLNLETLIQFKHGIFVIFKNNLNGFDILMMVPMWMLVCPKWELKSFWNSEVFLVLLESLVGESNLIEVITQGVENIDF